MKVLVVAATSMEIARFKEACGDEVDTLITGVGMAATTYALTKHLQHNSYDFVIQAGVAGSFDTELPLGEVVQLVSDRYGDMGAEDHEDSLDLFDMGLTDANEFPFSDGSLRVPESDYDKHIQLRKVSGITVNTVSGSEKTIARRKQYGCELESMEGAAFHLVCLQERVPFVQIRSISNYVTPRDKSSWKMKEAIIKLNDWLIAFIEQR